MRTYREYQCDRCLETFNRFFYYIHIGYEIFFTVLFIFKVLVFQLNEGRKLTKTENKPCEICMHSARWHVMSFDSVKELLTYSDITPFHLVRIKLKPTSPKEFNDCVRCLFSRRPSNSNHLYEPLGNLQYIEWLYNKGDRNETPGK